MSDGFFLAELPADVAAGAIVEVVGREAHHLAVVRRIGPGEVVTVADGQGHGVRGPVVTAAKDRVTLAVEAVLSAAPPRPPVTVVQALPKNDRAELAVDLMTELGVDRIVPWAASRSIVKWSGERGEKARAKWQAVAREAAKQSRRLWVPEVTELVTTKQLVAWLGQQVGRPCQDDKPTPCHPERSEGSRPQQAEILRFAQDDRGGAQDDWGGAQVILMYEDATTPVATLHVDPDRPVIVIIGPEGGIAPDELELFEGVGAVTLSMGPTILRTSTAGAVAVTQVRLLAEVGR